VVVFMATSIGRSDATSASRTLPGSGQLRDWSYVSGSTRTIQVTLQAGLGNGRTDSVGDFVVGQGIAIPKAGQLTTSSIPSKPGVQSACPDAKCDAPYRYQTVALDNACGSSAASAPSLEVKNVGKLDYKHYNTVSILVENNTESYLVFRGSEPVGIVPATSKSDNDFVVIFRDVGSPFSIGSPCLPRTPPLASTPDALYTTIVSLEGKSFRLKDSAGSAVQSQTAYHDDAGAILSALETLDPGAGGTVKLPPKRFVLSRPIQIGSANKSAIAPGLVGNRSHGELLASPMMQGMPVIRITNAFESYVGHVSISGSLEAEPLAAIEHNVDHPGGRGRQVPGSYVGNALDEDIDDSMNSPLYGIIYTAAPGSDENNSENTIRDFNGGGSSAGVWYCHLNSLQNRIFGGNIAGVLEGAIKFTGGSANVWGSVLSSGDNGYLIYMDKGYITHDCAFHGLQSESAAGLIYVAQDASTNNYLIAFDGGDFEISPHNFDHNSVDFENRSLSLSMEQVRLAEGAISNWNTDARETKLIDNRLGMTSIKGTSHVIALANFFTSTVPTNLMGPPGSWVGTLNASEGACDNCFLNRTK
jgi:hypothetical protein